MGRKRLKEDGEIRRKERQQEEGIKNGEIRRKETLQEEGIKEEDLRRD